MYPPKHHQEFDIDKLKETIKQFPLATVISIKDNLPVISHLPLILKPVGRGKLSKRLKIHTSRDHKMCTI